MRRAGRSPARWRWWPGQARSPRRGVPTAPQRRVARRREARLRRGALDCRYTRSFLAPCCCGWLQIEGARALGPFARTVLHEFLDLDLGFVDARHDAEV